MPKSAALAANLVPLFSGGALPPTGTPSGPPAGGASPPPAAGAVRILSRYPRVPQEQLNWCWAAVALGVESFHRGAPLSTTQCDLATTELAAELATRGVANSACCPNGSNAACDIEWYLQNPLNRLGHYGGYAVGPPDFLTEVVPQIDADRPIAVRLEWAGTGGRAHFVVIRGYKNDPGNEKVYVDDPAPMGVGSRTEEKYATFVTMYRGSGRVTHTLWTTP